jgi:hypothetical protein
VRLPIIWGAALVALWAPPRARAQQVTDVRVRDANGQFDLWIPTPKRPDDNYTNGAQLFIGVDGALLWGRLFARHSPACARATDGADRRCASSEIRFGQDMYTPRSALTATEPVPGERPYAGWLYLAETGRLATARRSDAVTLELGVTGRPSLAEAIQTNWHSLIGYPRALGWTHQIPFEPGILVAYEHRQEVWRVRVGDVPIVSLVPAGNVSVGNVLTGASVGMDARVGYAATTPWTSSERRHRKPVALYALAGAREDWIAYNLFLDHSTTDPAVHVDKRSWVTQYDVGAGARLWMLELEFRGITRTREYATDRPTEPYAVISVGWSGGW